jgi:ectoine hydroxylase-related dioxygenase (phytanoyl-CoA dioxygenase family)
MNAIFKSNKLQTEFDKQGYVVLNVLEKKECDELISFHATLSPNIENNFFATQNSENYSYRKAVENYLHPIFEKLIQPIFLDHRVLYTQFMVKKSGQNGECRMHQDWNFVDEPFYYAVNFWCALSDTNIQNGCLWLMPGSHKLKTRIRGRNIERPSSKEENFIRKFFLKPIQLKKGQAILFNAATIHESRSNASQFTRVAAAAMIIPKNAKPIHYLAKQPGSSTLFKVEADTDFYVENCGLGMPEKISVIEEITHTIKPYTKTELLQCYLAAKI